MRLMLEIVPSFDGVFENVNKHAIQGMIYAHLKDTKYSTYHDSNRFKFFSFSDIFPVSNFTKGVKKNLLISSPNNDLINTIYLSLKNVKIIHIKEMEFEVEAVKIFTLNPSRMYISASPIVLYKDNHLNEYFSFERDNDLNFFLERLKENALNKYFAYTGNHIDFSENLFDRLVFRKEVAVKDYKDGKEFIIIGSMWKVLEKNYIRDKYKYLYEFIMDCGLGEKNSLGFGFINPIRQEK